MTLKGFHTGWNSERWILWDIVNSYIITNRSRLFLTGQTLHPLSVTSSSDLPCFSISGEGDPAVQSDEHQRHSSGPVLHPAPALLPAADPTVRLHWPRGGPCDSAKRPPRLPGPLLHHAQLHQAQRVKCGGGGGGKLFFFTIQSVCTGSDSWQGTASVRSRHVLRLSVCSTLDHKAKTLKLYRIPSKGTRDILSYILNYITAGIML